MWVLTWNRTPALGVPPRGDCTAAGFRLLLPLLLSLGRGLKVLGFPLLQHPHMPDVTPG